jgi:hypothetical protein
MDELRKLLEMAEQKENELRDIYKNIYKLKKSLSQQATSLNDIELFNNLSKEDKNSVNGSTAACWRIFTSDIKNRSDIDCVEFAKKWFDKCGEKFIETNVSFHDIVVRFHHLKNKKSL